MDNTIIEVWFPDMPRAKVGGTYANSGRVIAKIDIETIANRVLFKCFDKDSNLIGITVSEEYQITYENIIKEDELPY